MAGRKWTEEELVLVQENYPVLEKDELMKLFPGRSFRSLECQASRLGVQRPSNAWTDEELDVLRRHYPISTPDEIQVLLPNRTNQTITHMANKLGIYREDFRWTEEEDNLLRKYYSVKTVTQLLPMFPNRTDNGIKLRARKLDLWQDERLYRRIYSHKEDFFTIPNITNSYYAGLLAADGNITKTMDTFSIGLAEKDEELLVEFKKSLDFTGDLYRFIHKPSKTALARVESKMVKLSISSAQQAISDLKTNFNLTPQKTLTLKPPNVTGDNALAFIAGYIDGDGSVSLGFKQRKRVSDYPEISISAAGTFEVLSWIKSIFDEMCPPDTNRTSSQVLKQKDSNIWVYKLSGVRAVCIIEELLKLSLPIRLKRKWDNYYEYKRVVESREKY